MMEDRRAYLKFHPKLDKSGSLDSASEVIQNLTS